MRVIDITDDYVLGTPLQILPKLAADYDGDVLNVYYIINEDFRIQCDKVLNPRNAMYISRNDGWFDNDLNHTKDLVINMNTLMNLCRKNYSKEQMDKIRKIKELNTPINSLVEIVS